MNKPSYAKVVERVCGGSRVYVSRTQVQLWFNRFKQGRKDFKDDARPGRPITSIIYENIEEVKKIIMYKR